MGLMIETGEKNEDGTPKMIEFVTDETPATPTIATTAVLTIQVVGNRYNEDNTLKINGVAQEENEWPQVIQFAGINWRFQDVDDEYNEDEDDDGNTFSMELADYVQD